MGLKIQNWMLKGSGEELTDALCSRSPSVSGGRLLMDVNRTARWMPCLHTPHKVALSRVVLDRAAAGHLDMGSDDS